MMLFAHAIKMKRPCASNRGLKRPLTARALAATPPLCTFRHVPRKIRQLAADLVRAGFVQVPGGKDRIENFATRNFPARLFSVATMGTTLTVTRKSN